MKIKLDPERCSATVPGPGGWQRHQCGRKGKVEEEGKLWCRQHAPSEVKRRGDERRAKWERWKAEEEAARDAERMDFLQSLVERRCVLRMSVLGRGFRLHECDGKQPGYSNVREAIDRFMEVHGAVSEEETGDRRDDRGDDADRPAGREGPRDGEAG